MNKKYAVIYIQDGYQNEFHFYKLKYARTLFDEIKFNDFENRVSSIKIESLITGKILKEYNN